MCVCVCVCVCVREWGRLDQRLNPTHLRTGQHMLMRNTAGISRPIPRT